ncbi:hypothetical protein B9P82_23815 [Citrobacter sp. L55]|uniref:PapB/FocB family fimbrial expression transcriptional regulator n=1 Tax=Citrobacter sp. L55 TaxID=1981983 RepID=UPI000C76B816|nr:PapB/FocB family fimbrial expression transcriptional regulator [Citrobacter sp. L55]PLC60644.1 hypothetical protein B9P82_23815 [Citrobacter sp. L55]
MSTVKYDSLHIQRTNPGLMPGKVDIRYFRLLIKVCVLHSVPVRNALEDFLVHGLSRQEACEKNNVSQSNLSVKYRHMRVVSETIACICSLKLSEEKSAEGYAVD